jgi:hypothetical protein
MPQTIYRYHPMTGVYAGRSDWTPPYPGIALPGNATTEAPPECEAGTVAVYRDGAWVTLSDHRGETVYRTDTATAITITDLGVLPDGVTSQMPPDYPIWDADAESWTQDADAARAAVLASIDTALDALDAATVRPLRALLAADAAGTDRDPDDLDKLADLETQAAALRATRAEVAVMIEVAAILTVPVEVDA